MFTLRTTLSTMPTWAASSSLVKISLSTRTSVNRDTASWRHSWLAVVESTRCTSSGSAAARSLFSSLSFSVSLGLRPAVSIRMKSQSAHRPHRVAQIVGPVHHAQRRADDVGVTLELIDGGDAIGVERDQPDAMLLAELQIGGELGDRGGLADAGRPDQGDDVRAGRSWCG